jgi:hypothetical protein
MYLHLLEKDEKPHFLAFARHLAEVDDQRVDARERYMLNYMCAEMGIEAVDVESLPFNLDQLVKVFYRGEARRVLIVEAIGVCHANGQTHPAQRELLEKIAARFFLPEDFLARAEALVARQLAVMQEFDALLEAE